MSNRLMVKLNKKPCYDILIENDLSALNNEITNLYPEKRKLCIISESNVFPLWGEKVINTLKETGFEVLHYEFKAGEENKTLATVNKIYEFLIKEHFERRDVLVALGGGVCGDITGYAAATYLRGIDFIQIPTTLLSFVDSSVGGKTGVDYKGYKNMVGAFKMPRLVYIDTEFLNTISDRMYYSGFAEVMKAALIKDGEFYEWLISNMYEICEKDKDVVSEMIFRSVDIKRQVVEKDPFEKDERRLLNFGHTIGHAIEKYKKYTLSHGECVALGCVAASYISLKKGFITNDEHYEIRDMFVPFNLPITVSDIEPKKILKILKSDKKAKNGIVSFVLLKKPGKAFVCDEVSDKEILEGINAVFFDINAND
ncbi:MAG: 3-dehydroquinate synthase [Lachnospiraceae bacterium]|nr:3-dehydroquinate synthase [Lachnospiraceae bacterium]